MDDKTRRRIQLDCFYEMFGDRIDESVIYIVYTENEGKIDVTIDQLMSIASCAFTGYSFDNDAKNGQTSGRSQSNSSCKQKANLTLRSKILTGEKQVATTSTCRSPNCGPDNRRSSRKQDRSLPNLHRKEKENDKLQTSDVESHIQDDGDDLGITIDEQIQRLQESIDNLLLEKKASHDKASYYLTKKMFPVTSYYSELSGQFRRLVEKKTSKLVDLLLTKSKNANYIDLHGLNPIQARLVVSELLKIRQDKLMIDKRGEVTIDIITGWGKHTVTPGQKIRPAIVSLLREGGFEYTHLNKGALRVKIRRN